jgi:hypothetical protein
MTDELLDHFKKEKRAKVKKKETQAYRNILGIVWAVFAIYVISVGFGWFRINYKMGARTDGIFELIEMYVPEAELAYMYVIQGIMSFIVSAVILINKTNRKNFLLVYLGILGLFYILGLLFFSIIDPLTVLQALFCGVLVFASLSRYKDDFSPFNLLNLKRKEILMLLIGFLPFIMEDIVDYKQIHFWDLRWIDIWLM